jgi:MFS transporter, FSR family, fosmidomycin resistance protein
VTPLVLVFGLHGTLLLAVIPTIVAVVLARELGRLRLVAAEKSANFERDLADEDRDQDDWNAFVRLGGVVSLRSGVYFGLQAFIPLWFIHHLGTGEGTGNAALTAMLIAGAVGTYSGGRVVDRVGRRRLVVGSTLLTIPVLVALVLAPTPLTAGLLTAVAGFLIILTFSITVVMSQEYLPSRLGLASGVSLGLAIGVGGIAAAGLGVVADAYGLPTVMWLIVALAVPMVVLARTLPVTRAERRAQDVAASTAAAVRPASAVRHATAPGSATPHP